MFETYIAFDYRTLPPFVKIMHFYCGLKYLGKGLSRGVGVSFLRPFFFSKKVPFFHKKVPFQANIERCPVFLEYALYIIQILHK